MRIQSADRKQSDDCCHLILTLTLTSMVPGVSHKVTKVLKDPRDRRETQEFQEHLEKLVRLFFLSSKELRSGIHVIVV